MKALRFHQLKPSRQIHRAAQNLVELDIAQADAVEARAILDLRIGAAFTRLQTLALQDHLPGLEIRVASYGVYLSRYRRISFSNFE
jgi:DNA topoisomerase-3